MASSDAMGAATEGSDLAFGESLRVRIGPGEGTTVNGDEYSFGCSLRRDWPCLWFDCNKTPFGKRSLLLIHKLKLRWHLMGTYKF